MFTRRIAVTGIGVVAPGGNNRKTFWQTITAGRTATGKITLFNPTGFRSQIAAECDFDPLGAGLAQEEAKRASPYLYDALIPSSLASELASRFQTHGPATVVSTGCTSGIDAIGYGFYLIQDGE